MFEQLSRGLCCSWSSVCSNAVGRAHVTKNVILCYRSHIWWTYDVWMTVTNFSAIWPIAGAMTALFYCAWRNLFVCMYVCMAAFRIAKEPFLWSTSHLLGVLLRTQRSAVLSVILIGWVVLKSTVLNNTASSPSWGEASSHVQNRHGGVASQWCCHLNDVVTWGPSKGQGDFLFSILLQMIKN